MSLVGAHDCFCYDITQTMQVDSCAIILEMGCAYH